MKQAGTILLTGASGFIGSYIARSLATKGLNIRYLLRSSSNRSSLPTSTEASQIIEGDLLDDHLLDDALKGCSTVIHTAAKVSFHSKDEQEMILVNETGTANLVNACLSNGVERFVHLSSVAALGRVSGKPTSLEDRWQETPAPTAYGRSKFAAEREVWRGQAEGLSVAVLYPSTVIGAGDWTRPGTPHLFRAAAQGRKFASAGSGGFVAIDDVVKAVQYALASKEDGLRLLLNAENWTWEKALRLIAESVNATPPSATIGKTASGLLWPLASISAKITGKPASLTQDLHRTAQAEYSYDGRLYEKVTGSHYRSVEEVIRATGHEYLEAFS